jgi:hypothetical protein
MYIYIRSPGSPRVFKKKTADFFGIAEGDNGATDGAAGE